MKVAIVSEKPKAIISKYEITRSNPIIWSAISLINFPPLKKRKNAKAKGRSIPATMYFAKLVVLNYDELYLANIFDYRNLGFLHGTGELYLSHVKNYNKLYSSIIRLLFYETVQSC